MKTKLKAIPNKIEVKIKTEIEIEAQFSRCSSLLLRLDLNGWSTAGSALAGLVEKSVQSLRLAEGKVEVDVKSEVVVRIL